MFQGGMRAETSRAMDLGPSAEKANKKRTVCISDTLASQRTSGYVVILHARVHQNACHLASKIRAWQRAARNTFSKQKAKGDVWRCWQSTNSGWRAVELGRQETSMVKFFKRRWTLYQ